MCIHKINFNEKCILVNSQYFGDAGQICRSRFMQTDEIIICDWPGTNHASEFRGHI